MESVKRQEKLRGFGCRYTMYIVERDKQLVVAYAPKFADAMEKLKGFSATEIVETLCREYPLKRMHLMIFDREQVQEFKDARTLRQADYSDYENFFREANPKSNPEGWLFEYFCEKVEKGFFTGYYKDNRLVSVCDAPDMPFMEGQIQHTGITTLPEERGRGYGKRTAALATHILLEKDICPQWECDESNTPSFCLAKSIGYEEFGTAYILED